jgi:hypothetical protein
VSPDIVERSTCVLIEGRVKCWGEFPSVNDGVPTGSVAYSALRLGGGNACALTASGRATCWGEFADDRDLPATTWRDLALNMSNTVCGVTDEGALRCLVWSAFETYLASHPDQPSETPFGAKTPDDTRSFLANVPPGSDFVRVALKGPFSGACALRSSGMLVCWGPDQPPAMPFQDASLIDFATLPLVCGVDRSGQPRCEPTAGPSVVGEPGTRYDAIAAGGDEACFRRTTDSTWLCYGVTLDPGLGRCGRGPPAAMRELAIGMFYACGVSLSGKLFCWESDASRSSEADIPTWLR